MARRTAKDFREAPIDAVGYIDFGPGKRAKRKRIPLGPDYHAEPGETKGHQHDVYTTKGELHGYTRIHVGTLMKSAVEDLARLTATDAKALRSAVAALIHKHVRLEWHGHDHADINYRSTEAAAEEILALLAAPSISAGENGR